MPNFDFVITATAIGYATIEADSEDEAREEMRDNLAFTANGADIDWQHYNDPSIDSVEQVRP